MLAEASQYSVDLRDVRGQMYETTKDTRAYLALGFPTVQAWMNARLGESLSSVFSALRSIRALEGVPEEKLKRIGERNAHTLTHLTEKERKSEEWLEKAATLPTKEFKQEVQIALEQKTGLRKERFKTFSVALLVNIEKIAKGLKKSLPELFGRV